MTGFGLRLWHRAHRQRLLFTAVFGRVWSPVLGVFLAVLLWYLLLLRRRHPE